MSRLVRPFFLAAALGFLFALFLLPASVRAEAPQAGAQAPGFEQFS